MIAMIFEVWPNAEHKQEYLDTAAQLRPLLESIPGFISNERFESLNEPGKILSLAFFEDEVSLTHWRNLPEHRKAQSAGRNTFFNNYRLRIAEISRDYGMDDRAQAPSDSQRVHSSA